MAPDIPRVSSFVTYYTHEQLDGKNSTVDALGIVMAATKDWVDLKVIKAGVLPYDVRAVQFDPKAWAAAPPEERQVGLSYWRPLDSKPPDWPEHLPQPKSPAGLFPPPPASRVL
jgi:hypothetical protein